MSLLGISNAMGVTPSSLTELLGGRAPVSVRGRLGTLSGSLQEFLDGGTSSGLAGRIGCTSAALQELRNVIGDTGAIGLLIGLCITSRSR